MKGWIEANVLATNVNDKSLRFFRKILIRLDQIINVAQIIRTPEDPEDAIERICDAEILLKGEFGRAIVVKDTYDELKQKIKEAQ